MSVIFTPSAREMFTPRELVAAYKEFTEHGGQQQDAESWSRPQRTALASVCSSFTRRLRRVWCSLLTHVRGREILRSPNAGLRTTPFPYSQKQPMSPHQSIRVNTTSCDTG
jgi:hypothetical protein